MNWKDRLLVLWTPIQGYVGIFLCAAGVAVLAGAQTKSLLFAVGAGTLVMGSLLLFDAWRGEGLEAKRTDGK
jgi:hypothetical protein